MYIMKNLPVWKGYNSKDIVEFKRWARDNYEIGTEISSEYHQITRSECELMNEEVCYRLIRRNT